MEFRNRCLLILALPRHLAFSRHYKVTGKCQNGTFPSLNGIFPSKCQNKIDVYFSRITYMPLLHMLHSLHQNTLSMSTSRETSAYVPFCSACQVELLSWNILTPGNDTWDLYLEKIGSWNWLNLTYFDHSLDHHHFHRYGISSWGFLSCHRIMAQTLIHLVSLLHYRPSWSVWPCSSSS